MTIFMHIYIPFQLEFMNLCRWMCEEEVKIAVVSVLL